MPPLRERPGDVPALAYHSLAAAAQVHRRASVTISPKAVRWLQAQPWPGNVRQLKQLVERTLLMTDSDRARGRGLRAAGAMEGRGAPAMPCRLPGR